VDASLEDGSTATPSEHVSLDETVAGLKAKGVDLSADLPGPTPAVLLEVRMKDTVVIVSAFRISTCLRATIRASTRTYLKIVS
jgi:hypothetical protein